MKDTKGTCRYCGAPTDPGLNKCIKHQMKPNLAREIALGTLWLLILGALFTGGWRIMKRLFLE